MSKLIISDDVRALSDIGAALLVKKAEDTHYHLLALVDSIPGIGSAPATIESTVAGSNTKSYIPGKVDVEQITTNCMNHRDNLTRLAEYKNISCKYMVYYADGTAYPFTAKLSFTPLSIGADETAKLELQFTISSFDNEPILNAADLIMPTVTFNEVPAEVTLDSTTAVKTLDLVTIPSDATLSVELDSSGIATATISGKTLTITGQAAGSVVATITGAGTGYYKGITTILINVPE